MERDIRTVLIKDIEKQLVASKHYLYVDPTQESAIISQLIKQYNIVSGTAEIRTRTLDLLCRKSIPIS